MFEIFELGRVLENAQVDSDANSLSTKHRYEATS